jgi:SAM-dependent methyltransferase
LRRDAKAYPSELHPDTSHSHAVDLLERSGRRSGVVLDLGCGNAPVAEPLAALGFDYVALDLDEGSLEALRERGFEAHPVDLTAPTPELAAALASVLGDRPLAAVLTLDVLEHLVDPSSALAAVSQVAQGHDGCSLVVSVPNVTHVDLGTRLLLGRWETTPQGLLDDTHLRFFSPTGFERLFAATPWREVDAFDTEAFHSDQFDMERLTALQPGTPLRDLLWRIRGDAAPHATTYQFVRRFELAADREAVPATAGSGAGGGEPEVPRPFATVVVRVAEAVDVDGLAPLLRDLAAQEDADAEVVVLVAGGFDVAAVVEAARHRDGLALPTRVRPTLGDGDDRNAALPVARGFYLCFLDAGDRVGPRYLSALRRAAPDLTRPDTTDVVVRIDAAVRSAADLAAGHAKSFDVLVEEGAAVDPDGFDLLRAGPLGRTALGAYAVPAAVCATVGLRFLDYHGEAAPTLFVARAAELCGLRGVGDVQLLTTPERARDGAADFEAVCHRLGELPYVLGDGGVARMAALRRQASGAAERERLLTEELRRADEALAEARADRDRHLADVRGLAGSRAFRLDRAARRAVRGIRRILR